MKESKMMQHLITTLEELLPIEFVEEYNRVFGTDLLIEDVEFDGAYKDFERENYDY